MTRAISSSVSPAPCAITIALANASDAPRVSAERAEQFLAVLVVQLGCFPSTRLYEPSICRSLVDARTPAERPPGLLALSRHVLQFALALLADDADSAQPSSPPASRS